MKLPGPGKLELVFTPSTPGGKPVVREIFDFKGKGGIGMGMYNTYESVTNFAH